MRIGLQIPSFTWPGGTTELRSKLNEIAKAAEKAGFYSIWVMDHFFQLPMIGAVDEPMLEGYSVLNYLAAITQRVKLGTLVTGVVYHHPSALIKSVTTLDVLSGGRAYFGIGAAWFKQEAVGLGFPFPSTKERFEHLEETLQITKLLWSDKREPFSGKHYQLAEPICSPQPISKPHPPILIAGGGEKKTLRFVAKYGNACNFVDYITHRKMKKKLEVLKMHCEDLSRPYDEIERTVLSTANISQGNMTGSDVINTCRKFADIGIQQVIFNMPNVHDITPLEIFGEEIIPGTADF